MMELRKSIGEFIHEVHKHNESFLLTYMGKPVAKLVPLDPEDKTFDEGTDE